MAATSKTLGDCGKCGQPVIAKATKALGKVYHPEHFCCKMCDAAVKKEFREKNGHPYCTACYIKMWSPKCATCGEPITEMAISAMDKSYHENCFKCTGCQSTFNESKFFIHDNKPYCSSCNEKEREKETQKGAYVYKPMAQK